MIPCDTRVASYGSGGSFSCLDEPQEKNCGYLVDENENQTCPYCGNYLQTQKEHMFGQNIREAFEIIKGINPIWNGYFNKENGKYELR